ncbi:family 78 glycoside hydrolase catalytic domain [Frondihabitans sp. PAMC 28766]|uniref:family 78 glycoside hydrolase catalytic domain n=1 Tax=Frondihabitans sp. PAMC 28766 TaxID=1795630 RepID=UPI00138F5BAC|nr:family 78 glycoside hydrolase catalytic domain [Frondihabitans sp. PAMC 28766]
MASGPAISPAPVQLRVDGHEPSHVGRRCVAVISVPRPYLSWVVPLIRDGQRQTGYEVAVSTTRSAGAEPDVWDSGLIETDQNTSIAWGGSPVPPHAKYFWSVRTRDEFGRVSDWSVPSVIESAAYSLGDWEATWISPPPTHAAAVTIPGAVGVESARLSVAGWGVARILIGQTVINDGEVSPTDSALARATSRTYDVTDEIPAAPFTVSVVMSLGHYRHVLDRPRLLAELRIHFMDGTTQVFGTSSEWRSVPTQVVQDQPFYLEEHDLREDDAGVAVPVEVTLASATPPPPVTVVPNVGPPVRDTRRVKAAWLSAPAHGVRVFDLGENVAGRVVLDLGPLPPGTRVTSTQGEKLDASGRVDTTNIRLPDDRDRQRQVFAVISAGAPAVVSPWFAIHGFRYVEVAGLPQGADVRVHARVIHSDAERTGHVTTSVPELDAVVDYAFRTQLNNTHGMPEDCPTREQGGWTGDASVSAEAALAHLDLSGMYQNWLADVALEADKDGGIPGIAPQLNGEFGAQPADPVWGSAMTEIPWQIWQATGETWRFESLLPTMRQWADWQLATLVDGVVRRSGISFGADWLAPVQTPPVVLQTGAVIVSLRQLADLEGASGNTAAAITRRAQAAHVVQGARKHLRDLLNGIWGNDSQGSSATALVSGMAPDEDVDGLRARLRADVRDRGDRLSTGFAATRSAVRALAGADGGSSLLDAVLQKHQPGIGSMLVDGPGTFWETWWIDDDNIGVASLDHIGLGAPYAAWVWRDVAGLRPLEPGFRRFAVAPRLTSRVTSASFTRETPRGTIRADWSVDSGRFTCQVTVPVGSVAEVRIPGGDIIEVGSGTHTVAGITTTIEPDPPQRPPLRHEYSGEQWLSDGILTSWEPCGETTVTIEPGAPICAPVYHEPIPGPTLDIVVPDFVADEDDVVVFRPNAPLNLTSASFLYAHFDTDNSRIIGRAIRIFLRVRSANGSIREEQARPLPIAWNRVAVDVSSWEDRSDITEIAVGVRWSDEPDTAFGPYLPLPPAPRRFDYRLGRIGWSAGPITY